MGNSRELIKDLMDAGFTKARQTGSHHVFVKAGFPIIVVPHPTKDLGKGIEKKLRRDAGL